MILRELIISKINEISFCLDSFRSQPSSLQIWDAFGKFRQNGILVYRKFDLGDLKFTHHRNKNPSSCHVLGC